MPVARPNKLAREKVGETVVAYYRSADAFLARADELAIRFDALSAPTRGRRHTLRLCLQLRPFQSTS